MKKILIVALILVVIGFVVGYKLWNKPHENISDQKVEFSLNAKDVLSEFEKSETDANIKFMNKIIEVSGKVANFESNDSTSIITLDTENPMSGIICELDPFSKHKRMKFEVGEAVKFKGICTGFLSDVIMSRCVECDK